MNPIFTHGNEEIPTFFQPTPLLHHGHIQTVSLADIYCTNAKKNELFFMTGASDSMKPTILDTDGMVVSITAEPRDNDIVLLRLNGGFLLARYWSNEESDKITFSFDNPRYLPHVETIKNIGIGLPVMVFGVVQSIHRKVV